MNSIYGYITGNTSNTQDQEQSKSETMADFNAFTNNLFNNSSQSQGAVWDWNNINTQADNILSLIGKGLDIFGEVKNSQGGSGSDQQYYPAPQQAGFQLNSDTILKLGMIGVGGLVLKELFSRKNDVVRRSSTPQVVN